MPDCGIDYLCRCVHPNALPPGDPNGNGKGAIEMSWLSDPGVWMALTTLTLLEMAFSIFVEVLNLRIRKRRREPIRLRSPRSAKILQ